MKEISNNEIINRFRESWIDVENFYDILIENYSWDKLKPIKELIFELKLKGENEHFRLGTSVHYLIISRSVEHGLRSDQKHIRIMQTSLNFKVELREGLKVDRELVSENLKDTEIEQFLKILKNTLID
jgi:hypothetical protein